MNKTLLSMVLVKGSSVKKNCRTGLGNVRVAFAGGSGAMRQIAHYYPFGLEMVGSIPDGVNNNGSPYFGKIEYAGRRIISSYIYARKNNK